MLISAVDQYYQSQKDQLALEGWGRANKTSREQQQQATNDARRGLAMTSNPLAVMYTFSPIAAGVEAAKEIDDGNLYMPREYYFWR